MIDIVDERRRVKAKYRLSSGADQYGYVHDYGLSYELPIQKEQKTFPKNGKRRGNYRVTESMPYNEGAAKRIFNVGSFIIRYNATLDDAIYYKARHALKGIRGDIFDAQKE